VKDIGLCNELRKLYNYVTRLGVGDWLPKKRKNRGRGKGGKGKESLVQCDLCGALVPRSKAKKITRTVSLIDPMLARELRQKGAIIPTYKITRYVCIRCAVFYGIVKIRPRSERKKRERLAL